MIYLYNILYDINIQYYQVLELMICTSGPAYWKMWMDVRNVNKMSIHRPSIRQGGEAATILNATALLWWQSCGSCDFYMALAQGSNSQATSY